MRLCAIYLAIFTIFCTVGCGGSTASAVPEDGANAGDGIVAPIEAGSIEAGQGKGEEAGAECVQKALADVAVSVTPGLVGLDGGAQTEGTFTGRIVSVGSPTIVVDGCGEDHACSPQIRTVQIDP